jgi:hypothetical protein
MKAAHLSLSPSEPYSKVFRRMWTGKSFKELTTKPSGQLLWLYLLTGPDCTVIPGLLPGMGIGTLADRLKWPYGSVKKCWAEIERAEMAAADWDAGLIWVPNGIVFNPPANPNVVTSWRSVVLPSSALVTRALSELRSSLERRGSKSFVTAFDEVYGGRYPDICARPVSLNGSLNGSDTKHIAADGDGLNGFENGSPNQDQDQDQDQQPPIPPLQGGVVPSTRKPSEAEREWAETVRKAHGGCPHEKAGEERCESAYVCVGKLVMRQRQHEAIGMNRAIEEASA